MIIHGIRPGPLIMVENPQFVYEVVVMMMLATFGIFFYGIFLVRPLLTVLRFPRTIIMPIVFVLCTVGTYAIAQRMFDVYVMIVFGIVGFVLRERGYPMAPLVLGIVLGDLLDKNLRRGLVLTDGDLTPFFTRPISLVMNRHDPAHGGAARACGHGCLRSHQGARGGRGGMTTTPFKISLCNEVVAAGRDFAKQCALAAQLGYDGLELAPFTLADDPSTLGPREAAAFRDTAKAEGLAITSCTGCWSSPTGSRSPAPTRRSTRARST